MIKAGVIGWPIKHTLSPHLHGWWLGHYAIDGSYEAYPVEPAELKDFVYQLHPAGFAGVNVTVPHKQAVVPFMSELSDTAARMGAVNTIVVQKDGRLFGDNTDGYGFITSLREELPEWNTQRPAVVLGAGGAARAVVDTLYGAGVPEIHIINRTRENAAKLATDLKVPARLHDWEHAPAILAQCGLLVNTTVLGMAGQPPLDLPLETLAPDAVVYDLIYNPLETWLVRSAKERGNAASGGLGMLLHQAVPGFASWFGRTPHVMPEQRKAIEALLS